jgi:hypothetical protein
MSKRKFSGRAAFVASVFSMAAVLPAAAQSVKDQLVGTWSVESNVEEYADGKKVSWDPSLKGMVVYDAGGRFVLMMAETGIRKKVEGNPALNPVGKMISYFGTYSVDEASKTLTHKIVGSSFPNWDGSEQKRVVTSINASGMVFKSAAPIPSAQGPFVPVVTWKKN